MRRFLRVCSILVLGGVLCVRLGTEAAFGAEIRGLPQQSPDKGIKPPAPVQQPGFRAVQPVKIPVSLPLTLNVTVLKAAEISLKWNKVESTGYRIDRKKGNESFTQLVLMASGETSFIDINVAPNTTYTYRIFGGKAGKDVYSNEVKVTTGNDNPYTETVPCLATINVQTSIPNYGVWQGTSWHDTGKLYGVSTMEGYDSAGGQNLRCHYRNCDTCPTWVVNRVVPANSCKRTDAVSGYGDKSFKCRKGAF